MNAQRHLLYSPLQLRHQVLNRWLVTAAAARNVRFEPMTMEGDINDWLIKGFSIHENPCRKEFVEKRRASAPHPPAGGCPVPGERTALLEQDLEWNVYFPWGNPRVEESGFYHVPTHLARYAWSVIVSPSAHRARLNLKTCGGAALWANGRLVCDFTPFTRNIEQSVEVEIDLAAGENTLAVLHEDLAERDTLYHFTLEYMGSETLEIRIPLSGSDDAGAVREMEGAFEQAFLPKDSMRDEEVRLIFPCPFGEKTEFEVKYGSFFAGIRSLKREVGAGGSELALFHTDDFGADYKYVEVGARIGRVAIRKLYGLEVYNSRWQPADSMGITVEERKRIGLRCVAEKGAANIHTALAMLKTGAAPAQTRELILQGLAGIRDRGDCSDFYLIALFRLWRDYRESGLFDESFWAQIKETILGFRYWIDEPGDDVMWFFSENHALLFHSCQLLAGQIFPDGIFTNSGETGAERWSKAERQLTGWFERFFAEGLAEWNSNAYIPIDVLGFVHLHDMAESAALRLAAKRALDLLYTYMAAEAHHGVLAVTFGRSYEKELLGNHAAGTTSLIWAGYGAGNVNSSSFNVPMYLSNYEPPQENAELQQLRPGEELTFLLEQGHGGYAKLYHYRTPGFALSSIADFRSGAKGYQEHVMHLSLSPEAQIWVNHPGEIYPYGTGRPCFWAGNGVLPKAGQYRGLGLLLFDIDPLHDAGYTHAYFPVHAFSCVERRGDWIFAEKGGAFTAVYAANGFDLTAEGPNRERELVSAGRRNIWLVRASDQLQFGTFGNFMAKMSEMRIEASTDSMRVRFADPEYGEVRFGWEDALTVRGEAVQIQGSGVRGRLERRGRDTVPCN